MVQRRRFGGTGVTRTVDRRRFGRGASVKTKQPIAQDKTPAERIQERGLSRAKQDLTVSEERLQNRIDRLANLARDGFQSEERAEKNRLQDEIDFIQNRIIPAKKQAIADIEKGINPAAAIEKSEARQSAAQEQEQLRQELRAKGTSIAEQRALREKARKEQLGTVTSFGETKVFGLEPGQQVTEVRRDVSGDIKFVQRIEQLREGQKRDVLTTETREVSQQPLEEVVREQQTTEAIKPTIPKQFVSNILTEAFAEPSREEVKEDIEKFKRAPGIRTGAEVISSGLRELSGFGQLKKFQELTFSLDDLTKETKTKLDDPFGAAIGAVGVLTPTTPGEAGLLIGGGQAFRALPPIVKIPSLGGVSVLKGKQALNPELKGRERTAAGLISVAAAAGAISEAAPFVKGATTRVTSPSKTVKEPGLKTDIKVVKTPGEQDIGLIPAGKGVSSKGFKPGTGATERGGFGFTPKEQRIAFGGKLTQGTTAQRSLITKGDIGSGRPVVRGDPNLPVFTTPADPVTGVAQARVSRLGLSDLFKFQTNTQLGFKAGDKPQILIEKGKTPGRLTPTTELEVLKGLPTVQRQLPPITIGGQKVDVFEVTFGSAPSGAVTTAGSSQAVSLVDPTGVAAISTTLGTTKVDINIPPTTTTKPTKETVKTTLTTTTPNFVKTRTFITERRRIKTPPTSTRVPTTTISPPTVPTTIKTPTTRPPSFPPTIKSPPITPTTKPPKIPKLPTRKKTPERRDRGSVLVEVKRAGKFRTIGRRATLQQGFNLGALRTGQTLARTFRLKGERGSLTGGIGQIPKEFRRKKKKRLTFVEKAQFALSTPGEILEIQTARKKKRKKKKK